MNIRNCSIVFIFSVITIFTIRETFPNDIDISSPKHKPLVTATFKKKDSDHNDSIYRVRVKSGGTSSASLTFMIEGTRKEITIADIKTVSIITDKVDSDGFVKARLVQADGSEVDSAKVLVQDMIGGVKLKGYTEVGKEYSIELADCREVEFSCSVKKVNGNSPGYATSPEDVKYMKKDVKTKFKVRALP
ncbi:MAG TPA: hypothetical protein VJ440_03090 [Candidatus Brocadiaceae bacterium]|nr:hypothetical protein [Candidatus Brocadiaceae bacterium]